MTGETPVERRLRDTAKRMRRIFDAELEAAAIDAGRESLALLKTWLVIDDAAHKMTEAEHGDHIEAWALNVRALLARCEGDR